MSEIRDYKDLIIWQKGIDVKYIINLLKEETRMLSALIKTLEK